MTLPGHLAVAYLFSRARAVHLPVRPVRLALVVFGALLPDLIDKPILLLGLSPYGRTVGHSLVFWGFAGLLWLVAAARRLPGAPALGLVLLGGVSHLLADLVDDVVEGYERSGYIFSAWPGWPYSNPDMYNVKVSHLLPHVAFWPTSLELLTVLACVGWAVRDARSPR